MDHSTQQKINNQKTETYYTLVLSFNEPLALYSFLISNKLLNRFFFTESN